MNIVIVITLVFMAACEYGYSHNTGVHKQHVNHDGFGYNLIFYEHNVSMACFTILILKVEQHFTAFGCIQICWKKCQAIPDAELCGF